MLINKADGWVLVVSCRVRSSPLKQSPGYQVELVIQLVWVSGEPPQPITSLAINSSYGLWVLIPHLLRLMTEGGTVRLTTSGIKMWPCVSGWCSGTATAWPWWTTSRRRCSSTWARRSSTARPTPTRGSLAPRAKPDSPLEVSCTRTPLANSLPVWKHLCNEFVIQLHSEDNCPELLWLVREAGWWHLAAAAAVPLHRRHPIPSLCSDTCPPTGGVTARPSICSVGADQRHCSSVRAHNLHRQGRAVFLLNYGTTLTSDFPASQGIAVSFFFFLILFHIILSVTAFFVLYILWVWSWIYVPHCVSVRQTLQISPMSRCKLWTT